MPPFFSKSPSWLTPGGAFCFYGGQFEESAVGEKLLPEAARDLVLKDADRLCEGLGELSQEKLADVLVESRNFGSGHDLLALENEEVAQHLGHADRPFELDGGFELGKDDGP